MRLPVLFLLTGLVPVVAACSTMPPTTTVAASPSVAARPAPVEGYDWFYNQDSREARLAYGLAESDDLRLGLDCEQGSGQLALSAVGGPGAKAEIRIEAGGETRRFAARSEPSQLHEGVFLTAEARADEPVFQRFRRLGWLAVWHDGERRAYAPHAASADAIERFFAHCG